MASDEHVLVIGATSMIAHESLKPYAVAGARMTLWARSVEKLERVQGDLQARGATLNGYAAVDVLDYPGMQLRIDEVFQSDFPPTTVLIAYGVLPDQEKALSDLEAFVAGQRVNFESVTVLSQLILKKFTERNSGHLAVISSVAGDRGRKSNFVYGSAKAGLSAYLEGWRGRLEGTGVSVALIKPGMVDTPMTADFEKGPLFASAPTVGAGVYKALTTKRSSEYYLPGLWRWIMLIIKWIPNRIMAKFSI